MLTHKGPKMLNSITTSVASKPDINLKTGPFLFLTPFLNKFHQNLWITGKPVIAGRKGKFDSAPS